MGNKETVCAVVVTYNRKDLLIECLDALCKQTRPIEAMYIIDNFSNDGTAELLLENGYIKELPPENLTEPFEMEMDFNNSEFLGAFDDGIEYREAKIENTIKIYYVRMNENTGGAGGFYEGQKRAYEKGFDWLWLMDDDGKPDDACLHSLIRDKNNNNFLNPLVIDIENNHNLSFGLSFNDRISIKTINEANKYSENNLLKNVANPFNGTFISRILIEKIGLIKKELFIWGDEVDYFMRAKNSNLGVATVTSALHRHPKGRLQTKRIFFDKFNIAYNDSDLKNYCLFRNQAYMVKKYSLWGSFIKNYLKYIWFFFIIKKIDLKGFIFYSKSTLDGLFEKWGGREKVSWKIDYLSQQIFVTQFSYFGRM